MRPLQDLLDALSGQQCLRHNRFRVFRTETMQKLPGPGTGSLAPGPTIFSPKKCSQFAGTLCSTCAGRYVHAPPPRRRRNLKSSRGLPIYIYIYIYIKKIIYKSVYNLPPPLQLRRRNR